MYAMGKGVPQNYETAAWLLRLAAEQGDADAQIALGGTYAALEDYINAYIWGDVAETNGQGNGGKVRDFAATRMRPDQIAETWKLTRECVRKKYKGC